MEQKKAIIYINLSVFLFGMAGLFAKWLDLPAICITFGRVMFSSISLFIYCRIVKQSLKIENCKYLVLMLIGGSVLAFHWWSFMEAIKLSTVAVGTITFSSFPMFVTFLEPIFFKEKIRVKNIIIAAIILLGVVITVPEFSFQNKIAEGIVLGMASAFAYAALTILNKVFAEHYKGIVTAFYEQFAATVVLLPCLLFADFSLSLSKVGLLLVLGVFTTAFAHTLFISSLKGISAQIAGVCSSMETVYGIILALLILNEVPTVRECVGAAVIIGVVIYSQLSIKGIKE